MYVAVLFFMVGCSPTYKRESMEESIKDLAKREYKLDVEVKETGETIGIRYEVKNFLGELVSSDQMVWNNIEDLMMVLGRVALSSDRPPRFLVLDVVDADHPTTHIIFTRYVQDIQKIMAEALSRTDFLDRLLIEFEINGVRSVFDPMEMDMVKLMMMASESMADEPAKLPGEKQKPEFKLQDVSYPSFLANVIANGLRRELKEKEEKEDNFSLRQVSGFYLPDEGSNKSFRFQLDVVPHQTKESLSDFISAQILPFVAVEVERVLKSYKFDQFSLITIVEKNSGKLLTVPKG
jgi:hypothetical protein